MPLQWGLLSPVMSLTLRRYLFWGPVYRLRNPRLVLSNIRLHFVFMAPSNTGNAFYWDNFCSSHSFMLAQKSLGFSRSRNWGSICKRFSLNYPGQIVAHRLRCSLRIYRASKQAYFSTLKNVRCGLKRHHKELFLPPFFFKISSKRKVVCWMFGQYNTRVAAYLQNVHPC